MSSSKKAPGTELVTTRRVRDLARGDAFKRPVIINKDLQKKDTPSLPQQFWVNNDLLLGTAGLLGIPASVAMAYLATGFTSVLFFIAAAISVALTVTSGVILYQREENNKFLTHERRKQLVQAERQRHSAPHAIARRARSRELDGKYDQFSVRLSYGRNSIVVALVIHTPWKEGRYKDDVMEVDEKLAKILYPERYEEAKKRLEEERKASKKAQEAKRQARKEERERRAQLGGYADEYYGDKEEPIYLDENGNEPEIQGLGTHAQLVVNREEGEDFEHFEDRVIQAQRTMEEVARRLEEESYEERKKALEIKRIALVHRR